MFDWLSQFISQSFCETEYNNSQSTYKQGVAYHNFQHLPSAGMNTDTCVNATFTADKLNAAKSYVQIADC